jgi:acyl dehydratase
LKAVFIGDTVTVNYTISDIDTDRKRSTGTIEVTNQDDELVAVGQHILQWVPNG